jgi:hypothetical protein
MWSGWRGSTRWAPTYTVAHGERSSPLGLNNPFGYTVRRYIGRTNGFNVSLWARPSVDIKLDEPGLELIRVKTERWLAHDRAILLEFDLIYHDSGDSNGELALIYDFERGELKSYGPFTAWFVQPFGGAPGRKMTRAEFDQAIRDLEVADQ